MMKIVFLIVNVALAASTIPLESATAWANIVAPYISECLCATSADQAVLQNWLFNSAFPNDACLKCAILCLVQKLGLMNPDGTVNIDATTQLVSKVPGTSIELAKECTNRTAHYIDRCELAFEYSSKCIQNALSQV